MKWWMYPFFPFTVVAFVVGVVLLTFGLAAFRAACFLVGLKGVPKTLTVTTSQEFSGTFYGLCPDCIRKIEKEVAQ